MLNIRSRLLGALGIVSLMFMVYSGYIKWIPGLFMDPFIFFSIVLFVSIIFSGFRNNIKKETLAIGSILLLFFFWAFISTIWGASQVYYIEKIKKSLVLVICFFSPFFVLRTEKRVSVFIMLFHWLTFLTATAIFTLFIIYGDLFFQLYGDSPADELLIPDYLALGVLLSSGFILAIQKTGKIWLIYKTFLIISIILLAPRGPLLTLGLFTLVYYTTNGKFKLYMAIYMLIAGLFVLYLGEGLTDRLIARFSGISDTNSSAFSSVGSRIQLLNSAVDYFMDSPFAGIGYGSFGVKFTGLEDRIEPHNILFEIAAETGLVGIVLFFIFILWVSFYAIRKKINNDASPNPLIILFLYLIIQSLSTTYLVDSKALFLWLSVLICILSKSKNIVEGDSN